MRRVFTRRSAVLIGLAGGLLVLMTTTQTWVTATGLGETSASQRIEIPGTDLAEATTAVALVGLAASVALTIARRIVRWIIGALLAAAGGVALFTAGSVAASPGEAALGPLGELTGTTEHAQHYAVGAAVWGTVVGAALLLAAGAIVLLASSRWRDAAASKKYARTGDDSAVRSPGDQDEPDEFDLWDGLSDGTDPTDRR